MVTLKNEQLTAVICERDAELKSLKREETEYIFEGDPAIWSYSAPMVFPICGALKDGKFTYRGKEYALMKHGFARTSIFDAKKLSDASAVFTLCSTEETKSAYPFDFELRVIFTLDNESIRVKYEVENLGADSMYFSIGSHEAYKTVGGIERFDVVFDGAVDLCKTVIEGDLTTEKTVPVLKSGARFPLCERDFENGGIVIRDIPTKSAALIERDTGRGVRVDFPDMKHMLLWHMVDAPYMCIEPWSGLPDAVSSDGRLENKLDITELSPGKTYVNEHVITLICPSEPCVPKESLI